MDVWMLPSEQPETKDAETGILGAFKLLFLQELSKSGQNVKNKPNEQQYRNTNQGLSVQICHNKVQLLSRYFVLHADFHPVSTFGLCDG